MWVYKRTEPGLWTVGFYAPDGTWNTDSDHGDREEAARRTAWLNGGHDPAGVDHRHEHRHPEYLGSI